MIRLIFGGRIRKVRRRVKTIGVRFALAEGPEFPLSLALTKRLRLMPSSAAFMAAPGLFGMTVIT
ncbi:MAG: hypothetical protein FJY82_04475 [Candidatus Aminicenantes bacterium]|nr:hypothetical protein [Candidatus Aminicenantes bacterium]